MFNFFSRQKNIECPVDEHTRLWMEYAFLWLVREFGEERIQNKQVILPNTQFFPYLFNGSVESLYKTAAIVAQQMDIDMDEINLQLYNDGIHSVGSRIYTEVDKTGGGSLAAGLYFGKDETGRYGIFIEKQHLTQPENLVALLAHGFARVILLKNMRTGKNGAYLADLATTVFGLGIFNANASFRTFSNAYSWGWQSIGFLKQPHWGYALALYAYYIGQENPAWMASLSANVKGDFKKAERYILANKDKVFLEEYKTFDKTAEDELFSGKWQGYYQYGKGYGIGYKGTLIPFVIDMEITGGQLLGTCADENLKGVFDEPAFIEGYIDNGKIYFTKTYPSHWSTKSPGRIEADKNRPSHKVNYEGYYKNNEFAGTWKIESLQTDRDGAIYTHVSRGTWGMTR